LPLTTAAAAVGVPRSTLHGWLRRDDRAGCRELRARIEQGRELAEATLVQRLGFDALHDPAAAARLLEAQWPERWAAPGDARRRREPDPSRP
jgi:hypothetical protein